MFEYIEKLLNRIKLTKSLRIIFVFAFFIPFVILSTLYTCILYNTMKKWELNRVQSNLEVVEQNVSRIMQNVTLVSDRIYVNRRLKKILQTNYIDIQQLYEDYITLSFLEDYLHTYKEISSFRIYTKNKSLLENQFIRSVTFKIENSIWYKQSLEKKGKPFWIYETDSLSKKKYLSLVRSIWDNSSGEFIGVLVINLNPNVLQEFLYEPNTETFIVYDSNILYASSAQTYDFYEEAIIKYIYQQDYSENKLSRITINDEKIGVVAVDFLPKESISLKLQIVVLIPVKDLIRSTRRVVFFTILIMISIVILLLLVIFVYSHHITARVNKINTEVENIVRNDFAISSSIGGKDEFAQIYNTIFNMSRELENLIGEVKKQTEEKNLLAIQQSEISFKMLSNQINPHFLFNTLETIRMKALASNDKDVATMLKLLASLLRYNLSIKGQPVLLIKELEAIQNYLNIQHMRFGERVSYDIVTMCDIQEFEILPLLIQPLVENSFSHGLENKVSGGFIYIMITSEKIGEKKRLIVTVKDNGSGISEDVLEEIRNKLKNYKQNDSTSSIGLINVQSRIKMYYGEESGISINSDVGDGTTVTLSLYI